MANIQLPWEVHGIITPEESVRNMIQVIKSKGIQHSGTFWTWENKVCNTIFCLTPADLICSRTHGDSVLSPSLPGTSPNYAPSSDSGIPSHPLTDASYSLPITHDPSLPSTAKPRYSISPNVLLTRSVSHSSLSSPAGNS
jgi:hypothetical protein